ncbi:MAG TPA: helix-turn-helix domain-containing protein [Solirubrobacteraceae bacterium]|nr:helix-turn-helix domain-containing protein [Solirubrobacteraceae bacterium]
MQHDLPPSLAAALRPTLPDLAAQTIAAIGREVPDYARPLEGPFGRALRTGVERALARFVDELERPSAPPDAAGAEIYRALGRAEQRAGRTLDALLSAYRLGARLAWERFVAAGEAAGHEPATLYRLAGAIFSYIDAISAESVEGYTDEQARAAGERQERRRALALVLARDDVPASEVAEVASLAGWRRPASVAALVAGGEAATFDADRLAARLGPEVVAATVDRLVVAFVADPGAPGRRAQLEAAVDGARGVLGPEVPLGRSAASLRRARAAHALLLDGRLPGGALTVADEHLAALVLHGGDPAAAADLAARALAPLDQLADGPRARLRDTLRAWLDRPGQVRRVAAELHVHPQTVRYRVGQLRELLGDRLEDPEARFELALALRASRPHASSDRLGGELPTQ